MGQWVVDLLRRTPEAALFSCLALGFLIGKPAIGPVRLGGTCGTLIVAILLGRYGIHLHPDLKNFAFALFIFALGFSAGPQLFASLDRSAWRIGVLSLVEVVMVLAVVLVSVAILHFDRGTAAGLLAGAATESAVVGTASDALSRLAMPAAEIARLQANVATTYSVSYLCGLITIVLFTSQIAPRLMGVDLAAESARIFAKRGGRGGGPSALPAIVGRRYVLERGDLGTIDELETRASGELTIERVRRSGVDVEVSPAMALRTGDEILVVGDRKAIVAVESSLGTEVDEPEQDVVAMSYAEVVVANAERGATLAAFRHSVLGRGDANGQIVEVRRGGESVPLLHDLAIRKGDVVRLFAEPRDLAILVPRIGYAVASPDRADLVVIGVGVLVGYLLGRPSLHLGSVALSLGTGGGALLSGLFFGWLRTKHPRIGTVPSAAAEILKDFGLATFIAAVGLAAGEHAFDLLRQFGFALPIVSILVTLVPTVTSLFLGRTLLKIETPVLIGAIAGQQCSTPAISAIVGAAKNTVPLLGYTVTYAISNVLLPLLGPIVVSLAGTVGAP